MEKHHTNGVTLKEYLNERIDNLRDKVDAIEKSNAEALRKSSVEIERRLEALNGEAGRITKVLDASIPREVHERDIKEITGKLEALTLSLKDRVTMDYLAATLKTPNEDIRNLNTVKDIGAGKTIQTTTIISFVASAIAIIIAAISLFK